MKWRRNGVWPGVLYTGCSSLQRRSLELRGGALLSWSSPLSHSSISFSVLQTHLPLLYFKCMRWSPAFGPLPILFPLPGRLPPLLPPFSHPPLSSKVTSAKSILQCNPPILTAPKFRSYCICNLTFLHMFIKWPGHPHYPRPGIA